MSKFIPIDIQRNKCYGNNYYETYSVKLKRNVRLFSELEFKNFLTIEMNPDIIDFCEQPLKIVIEIDGVLASSIFDMWVLYRNGTEEMQEIKYARDLEPTSELAKKSRWQVQKQELWCKANGYNYALRTEKEIELGTYYINNLRYLYGLVKRADTVLVRKYIIILLNRLLLNKVTINEIINEGIILYEYLLPCIAFGVYEGKIRVNIENKVICFNTELWINNPNYKL